MKEKPGRKPQDIVSEESNKALEAAFAEKLKGAELYTTTIIQAPGWNEELAEPEEQSDRIEAEGGKVCRVLSVTGVRDALAFLGQLPQDRAKTLLKNEMMERINPHWGSEPSMPPHNDIAGHLGISLRQKTVEKSNQAGKFRPELVDHTLIHVDVGTNGNGHELLAEVLAEDPQIRALIFGSDDEGRPVRNALLDGNDIPQRKEILLSFLAEAKQKSEEGSLTKRANRMWLARVSPDEPELTLIPMRGVSESISIPLCPSEENRQGEFVCFGTQEYLDFGYASELMVRLGQKGLRASFNPSTNYVDEGEEFNKSWIVNDDSLPRK